VESRLRRARERLRPSLARRGLAPSDWSPATLAVITARADLPPSMAAMARQVVAAPAGAVPAAVAELTRSTMRSLSMSRAVRIGLMFVALGVTAAGAAVLVDGGDEPKAKPAAPRVSAAQAATKPEAPPTERPAVDGRLEVRAVADATGRPIEGASIEWRLQINHGKVNRTTIATDGDGRAVFDWPSGSAVNTLEMTARKAGLVPYMIRWDDRAHAIHLPASRVIRLVPGIAIGGVVEDETGAPIAGAKITVHAPPTETETTGYSFDLAEATTDAGGRWRFADAPADLARVRVAIQAPRFLQTSSPPSRNLDAVTVLRRGFTVTGRVLDAQGRPIAGADVRAGDAWSPEPKPTKTDAQGAFLLENIPPGASTVTARAEGFAPDLREVHPEDRPALEFRLGPGHTLRGKIVDRQGRPLLGAIVVADAWRGHRSLDFRVDIGDDGRFEWRGAPADAVLYSVVKPGYVGRYRLAMPATGAEQVITLDLVPVISGRVTDAETGRPVPTFRVVRGLVYPNIPRVQWHTANAPEAAGGRYTAKYGEALEGYAIRIEAPGYKPAESRVFQPGEVTPTHDFALTRAGADDLLTGVVLGPDGRPAVGAEVALATPEHPLIFENEQFRLGRGNGMSFAKTGPDGRFTFEKPGGAYLLATTSDDGYAEATPGEMAKSGTLTLKPWGRIKGRARIGRQPAANQVISLNARRSYQPLGPGGVNAFYQVETRTDAQGQFAFDRVIPGAGEVARVIVTDYGNGMQQHMGCWQEPVDVAPGQTVLVHIGARGRPVVGRIALKAAPGVHADWRQNRPATLEKPRVLNPLPGLFGQDPRQNDRFAAGLDKDGRFRIDDVPPGRYELTVTIDAPRGLERPAMPEELGRVTVSVDVPEGNDDAPVDLGEIKADIRGR
jgi:hypothetical protein